MVGCNEILSPGLEIQDWKLKQEYWWFVEGTVKNVGGDFIPDRSEVMKLIKFARK